MTAHSNSYNILPKLLVIVGPTASGKSELVVKLAKLFNGEIISCDSRQIYKGMDIGTGKIPGKWIVDKTNGRNFYQHFVYKNIVHYCIDYVNPKRQYSASLFQSDTKKAITDILQRGKLPILCGGTAHWIDAVVYNQIIPDVKPNWKLRADLEKKSASALFKQLKKLDSVRAKNIDQFNKRRLIRALEIIITTGKPVPAVSSQLSAVSYAPLWLGIKTQQKDLYKKISLRLKQRLRAGMIKEVQHLHSPTGKGGARGGYGISWKRLEAFGLEYKFVSLFLQKKISQDEMFSQLLLAIEHYAKRQNTWWKRNQEINWIKPDIAKAKKLVEKLLQ